MKPNDTLIECPCYRICAGLGIAPNRWCSYHKSELPPPGTWRFDPKEKWCPPGVQANVMMLGFMLSGEKDKPEQLSTALEQVRQWARELREQDKSYQPSK